MTESASSRTGGPYPIRAITEDEFDSFEAVTQHAFHGSPLSESGRHMVLDRFEFDRTLAAWDGAAPVGVTSIYSFQLSVPGQEVLPAARVTYPGVRWSSRSPILRSGEKNTWARPGCPAR